MDNERDFSPVSSNEAVNEAMQVALSKILLKKDPSLWEKIAEQQGIKKSQETLTEGQCQRASQEVLKFVFTKYKDLFDIGVLLSVKNTPGNNFKHGEKWSTHELFLLQDKSGTFFLGSPANLRRSDLALKVYSNATIEGLFSDFSSQEDGPFLGWDMDKFKSLLNDVTRDGEHIPALDDDLKTETEIVCNGNNFSSQAIFIRD